MRLCRTIIVLVGVLLSACTSTSGITVDDLFSDTMRSVGPSGEAIKQGAAHSRLLTSSGADQGGVVGAYHEGTGSYVSARAPTIEASSTESSGKGYTLNLVDAPIKAAAKSVLGDTLGVNYSVDTRVAGTMSLQTSAPVGRDDLVDLFEASLSVAGAAIVRRGASYQIVPASDALASTPAISVPSVTPKGPGVAVQVIELRFVGAEEMKTILEPISRQGSILRADSTRNNLVIAGTAQDLKAMRDAIAVFDVDWMRGRSVALLPLKNAKPDAVAKEMEAVFGGGGKDLVRFVPNQRMNAILVIASQPNYLSRAEAWIRKLDQTSQSDGDQLFVYEIQNRPAKELAAVLRSVLKKGSTSPEAAPAVAAAEEPVAPDLDPARLGIAAVVDTTDQSEPQSEEGDVPSVVADVDNNALLVSTTAQNYKRIERIIRELDTLPTQVLLEAVIAEVTLNDELRFGLRWAVESGKFRLNLTDVAAGFAGANLPGAAAGFITDNIQVTLNALASVTDVNIVSSPTIMALNNQKATLQVGDQVPIITQQATGVENVNSRVVNAVQMKDTGLILNVTPRVNASGRVILDIDQEVSNVVETTTSGIDSPTIQQRRLTTKVVVNDGESIALGGLIQERNSLKRDQVPIVGEVPIFGNLFKNKSDKINRTELVIFIRPKVIRSIAEARDVTAEFRDKLSLQSGLAPRRQGKTRLQRDLNRLKY